MYFFLFLKVTKWREIQKSNLNNSLNDWVFEKKNSQSILRPMGPYPGYQRLFLASDEELSRPQAEDTSTETGNRAWKVSGTEGSAVNTNFGIILIMLRQFTSGPES